MDKQGGRFQDENPLARVGKKASSDSPSKGIRMQQLPTQDPDLAINPAIESRSPVKPSKSVKKADAPPSLDDLEGGKVSQPGRVASVRISGANAAAAISKVPEKTTRPVAEEKVEKKKERSEKSGEKGAASDNKLRFVGAYPLQYGLWAHYMTYGAVALCIWMGIFSILWVSPETYKCKIGNDPINSLYLFTSAGVCNNIVVIEETGENRAICCDPSIPYHSLKGNKIVGAIYVVYGVLLYLIENPNIGFGLWYPNDSLAYQYGISPISILNLGIGALGFASNATMLSGACLIILAFVQAYAARRREAGDGGRALRAAARAKMRQDEQLPWYSLKPFVQPAVDFCKTIPQWNPYTFFVRIYNEDKLSSYIWTFLYLGSNVVLFIVILFDWFEIAAGQISGLKDATLDLGCNTPICKMNRKIVRFGPLSAFAPFAKACGGCLNYNCALLLLPITKMLLRKINNAGVSFSNAQHSNDYFGKFFAHPLTRYIPLQKNIEFHKMCAGLIFFYAWGHMLMHYFNLIYADAATTTVFYMFGWVGFAWLTGTIVSIAMFFIYSAAPDVVRHAKFEIFFYSHHMFTVFYLVMFLHGPVFFYWTCIPVLLYLYERYSQTKRGNCPFVICKVEWISPVMAIYFRPVFKEDFVFKEGQYLYLNCPHISTKNWHPFTISSAYDDLDNGPRVNLQTGEEVIEVPKPPNLPPGAKWNKYCPVSQDWRNMSVHQLLDKSDTGYMDYVSVHIKVHGLDDPVAKSWTRKFKEYLELINTGGAAGKFPFYFSKRDHRGEISIGKLTGPDGLPIIRVDGPHSAPSEHYTSYGTVMLVGAGIGLTPCASILSALTKYRWRKNFNPEIIHFYWVVRQNEVDSFQWLVHMLTELSFEMKKGKEMHQIEKKYYCEINIYVTAADKSKKIEVKPLQRAARELGVEDSRAGLRITPSFSPDALYAEMMNPTVDSKGQIQKMKTQAANRFQDIWVWNGRPNWDEVFKEMREQRQHSDIGVCFCGAPAIGADLRGMCEKYSSVKEDCLFTLHKENF